MDYFVKEIDSKDARRIVSRYHYSGKVVPNSKLHLGIFKNVGYGDELVGCLSYGTSINSEKTTLKISDSLKMMELNRMVMTDHEPRNAESKALSMCNKWLKQNTDVEWLLSFSDGKEDNVGYIYQANNWKYLGYIISDSFYELDDNEFLHNISIWHKYKINTF